MCAILKEGRVFILLVSLGLLAICSGQMFDKRPTVYDHMKSGANSKKTNLIESDLKIVTEFLPEGCQPVNEDNLFGDRDDEISREKERLRLITAEVGDTVTVTYKVFLEADGTFIDSSTVPAEELGGEDTLHPAVFPVGYGLVIPGWDLGVKGMCVGEVRKLRIPPQLAYGTKGYKPKNIPADASLEMETELLYLKKKNFVDHYFDFIQSLPVYAFFILGLTFLLSGYYKSKIAEKRRLYREIEKKKQQMEEEEEDSEEENIEEMEREDQPENDE